VKVYLYTAEKEGKVEKGKLIAPSPLEVRLLLEGEGYRVKKIIPSINQIPALMGIPERVMAHFFDSLGLSLEAREQPWRTADIFLKEKKSYPLAFTSFLRFFRYYLQEGYQIHEALEYTGFVGKDVVGIVEAGIEGAKAPYVLRKLAGYYEKIGEIKKELSSVRNYFLLLLLPSLILVFLAPTFSEFGAKFYKNFSVPEPLFIKVLFFVMANLPEILFSFVVFLFLFYLFAKYRVSTSLNFKKKLDSLFLALPLVSELLVNASTYKAFLIMKTLLDAGLPINRIFRMIAEAQTNIPIKEEWEKAYRAVIEGRGEDEAVRLVKFVPGIVKSLIEVGAKTGRLSEVLGGVVRNQEIAFKASVEKIQRYIYPIFYFGMGIFVILIFIAIYYPIFTIKDALVMKLGGM